MPVQQNLSDVDSADQGLRDATMSFSAPTHGFTALGATSVVSTEVCTPGPTPGHRARVSCQGDIVKSGPFMS
jgi:hypothetical protein